MCDSGDDDCSAQRVVEARDGTFSSGVGERRLDKRVRRIVGTLWPRDAGVDAKGYPYPATSLDECRDALRGVFEKHGQLYAVFVEDVGESDNHHFHWALQPCKVKDDGDIIGVAVRLREVVSWFPSSFQYVWVAAASNWDGMIEYIEMKDFKPEYFGKFGRRTGPGKKVKTSAQGERTDIEHLKELLLGPSGIERIAWDEPESFLKYGRRSLLEWQQELRKRDLMRRREIIVVAIAGPTRIGKSTFVKDALDYGNYGEMASDTDHGRKVLWRDGVEADHPVAVLDEFDSTRLTVQEANTLCEGTPFKGQVKGGHQYQAWNAIFFISNIPVMNWFDTEKTAVYEAFQARVEDNKFEYFNKNVPRHALYDCGPHLERAGDFRSSPAELRAILVKVLRHCRLPVNPTLLDGCSESVARRCVAIFAGPSPHVWPDFSDVEPVPPSVSLCCDLQGCPGTKVEPAPCQNGERHVVLNLCEHHRLAHTIYFFDVVSHDPDVYRVDKDGETLNPEFDHGDCPLCAKLEPVHVEDDDDVTQAPCREKRVRRKSVSLSSRDFDTSGCPASVLPPSPIREEDAQEPL